MGIFKEYFLNSSLHGLNFIVDKRFHYTERLFWIMCVLASWTASLLLMYSAIEQFQSQEVSFSVDTSYLHWKTNFPSIVICEKSNNKKITEKNNEIFSNISEQLPKLENFSYYEGTILNKEFCEVGSILRDKCFLGNYSDYMQEFRSSCSEVIGFCYYNSEPFPCCEEFLVVKTYYGPCFAFNSLVSGKYPTHEDLPFKVIRNVEYGYGNLSIEIFHAGFRIYALSNDAVPTKDSSNNYALIDSDKEIKPNLYYKTFISIEPTFTDEESRMMGFENRGCRFYDENNLKHSKIYSLSACENECLVEAQRKSCGCAAHTLPHNVKNCTFDGLLCTIDNEEIRQSIKSCSCTSSCFDAEVNNLGFTGSPIKKYKFMDKRSILRVDFIVQPPTIQYSRSVVKNPLFMLVSVGGIAGLFLGASVLTIVEIVYYFIIRQLGSMYLKKSKGQRVKKSKKGELFDGCYYVYVN